MDQRPPAPVPPPVPLTRRQLLAAGGAALAAAARPARAAAQARRGEIVAGLSERMLTLDPANHYSISATSVLRHVYDPLVEVTNDSKFVPALAESWSAVNDTTWRFTLRKNVKFHDGTPFTADSVVFTLRRVRDNTKLIKAFVYQDIADVRKDGDHAVTVTTKRPFGSLPAHLTMLGILPAGAAGNEEAFFQKPIGTGPFRFVRWTHGEQIALTANDGYWRRGIPRVERVTFRFIPELSTRVAALRAGELHVIDRVWPDTVQVLKGTPGVRVLDTPAVEAQRWIFQLAKDPVKDPRVRHAISLAIDRNVIIKDLLLGYAQPVVSPIPPGLIGHTNLGQKPYDPERARQILKQAGYQHLTLDFVLMKDLYPKQLEIVQAVAAMLADVGITVNIKNLEIATARELRTAGNYDMFFSGWAHMPHDPDWYLGQWFTKAGAEKLTRYDNPKVEELIAAGRVPDPKVRQQRYEEIERILWEDEPEIWPYYSVAIYAISDRLQNFEARRDYYVLLYDVGIRA
ncbi:MAG TPA: ABC transporter substrate-binding protein [Methylomirabilota bacterium]|nr:ABC transporter substrate-binding protein [Methylomirabilota bacterium]